LDLAREVFHALIAFDPQVAAGYVGLGDVYAQKGEISTAIENYERAIELDARYQWVSVVIAQLSDGQG
jgi:lipoprotein NlpI